MDEEKKIIKDILVAKVFDNKTEVVINKGRDDGIKPSDKFFIHRYEGVIKDPKTGEALERLEHIVGTASVKHLQNKITTLRSNMRKNLGILNWTILQNNNDPVEPFDDPRWGDEVILKKREEEISLKKDNNGGTSCEVLTDKPDDIKEPNQ